MILITQLIYIIDGQERAFNEFESVAIRAISKYNGRLLLRLRPPEDSFIEAHIDKPYEIHLIEFETGQDLESFMQDEERRQFIHLRDQSVRMSIVIQGAQL